ASINQDNYEKIIQYTADGIYEATDGAHSLRNVRIYRNGSRQDADVIWRQAGGPSAWYMNQENIAANVNMYDQFSGRDFPANAASQEEGGYTLAHECQHYLYGVLDEYCVWNGRWVNLAANQKTQPCIMNNQWAAAGRIYTWLNHSIMYNTNAAVYAPYECRAGTAQYQAYNDGAWPTLSKNPTNDPLDTARRQWYRTNRGKRMYYPELAAVAPSGTNSPAINLSSATALADLVSRQNLNILWMGSNTVVEIIIDHSGSMAGYYDDNWNWIYDPAKMANARSAAQLLVDQIPDNSAVGVIAFDDTVSTVSPIIVVTSAVQRTTIKNAIATISPVGSTAIGDAAYAGLSQMQAFGHTNFTRVAFILSDGQSNTGSDPLSAAAAYQTAQIPIMTFGFGTITEIDADLMTMADMTGGNYYYSPSSLASIAAAFRDAFAAISAQQSLADGTYMASVASFKGQKSASISIPFQVDSTIADIDVTVSCALSNTVALTLNAPNGMPYSAISTNLSSSEKLLSFFVSSPITGLWTITGTVSISDALRYSVNSGVNGFSYYLTAVSMGGNTVAYPNPIQIVARLNRGESINDAVVKAIITDQQTNTTTLTLSNTADGTYSVNFMPSNGLYNIVVQADNSDGTATYTWADILP
ncbi:MAG: VWA domain-containing protein, partial [Kiritimatiellota bacterium]|nr:VWA domain-containing protein [Kiritimatiellota bacterium]